MIDGNRRVQVYCNVDHRVHMTSPVSKRLYVIEKGLSQNNYVRIPFSDLEAILMTNGGRSLYKRYLLIKDKDVIEDLNLEDKTIIDVNNLESALRMKNKQELERFLSEIDEDSKLELAKLAVRMKIKDLEKIVLIKEKTGYDILTSILNGDANFEPKKVIATEDKKNSLELDFDLNTVKKDILKDIAKEMSIDVGNSKKGTIIKKLEEMDKNKAIELAKKLS